ncbi:hypothetical protein DOTSEDRAFT_21185 [Dothistroma septosporum NZE10]|uniref:Uncharacterized protein n=1 Tax=Dothistroma septosporum (strain NZE10 / CBS 128990) TaxID=675120 RepID=N1PWM4_DOTSN|nr:hypothetical protein DOTSEDRAFT_21185 [Dothistroma septosporum NZE10]
MPPGHSIETVFGVVVGPQGWQLCESAGVVVGAATDSHGTSVDSCDREGTSSTLLEEEFQFGAGEFGAGMMSEVEVFSKSVCGSSGVGGAIESELMERQEEDEDFAAVTGVPIGSVVVDRTKVLLSDAMLVVANSVSVAVAN